MTLLLGSGARGQYSVGVESVTRTCQYYYFTVTNDEGVHYFPESGYYATTWNGFYMGQHLTFYECSDDWVASPVQETVTPPLPQLPSCPGRPYWMQLGPETGPWEPALLSSGTSNLYTKSVALQLNAPDHKQGEVFPPLISLKIFFDETNFGNGSYIPELPLTGSHAGDAHYGSVASSYDGVHLVAVENFGGGVLTSNNSGKDWYYQSGAPLGAWSAVASSADGLMLVAVMQVDTQGDLQLGSIWSSNDAGVTWCAQNSAPQANWLDVDCSIDGAFCVACSGGEPGVGTTLGTSQ